MQQELRIPPLRSHVGPRLLLDHKVRVKLSLGMLDTIETGPRYEIRVRVLQ